MPHYLEQFLGSVPADAQSTINQIVELHNQINSSAAQYPYGSYIYKQLADLYLTLKQQIATTPGISENIRTNEQLLKHLATQEDYYNELYNGESELNRSSISTQPVNGSYFENNVNPTMGGKRRRRNKTTRQRRNKRKQYHSSRRRLTNRKRR